VNEHDAGGQPRTWRNHRSDSIVIQVELLTYSHQRAHTSLREETGEEARQMRCASSHLGEDAEIEWFSLV